MPDPRLQQAIDYHLAGRLPEAETLYRAVLADNPDEPQANHNLGDIAFRAGQIEQAVALLQKALMADPQNERNWNSLINVLIEAGYPDDALKVREEGRALGILQAADQERPRRREQKADKTDAHRLPEQARRRIQEADTLLGLGKVDQAVALAGKIAAKYPDNGVAAHVYGQLLLAANRLTEALPVLERANALLPDNAEILTHLGYALKNAGRLRDAAKTLSRAVQIDEDNAEIHCDLAFVFNRLKDYSAALDHALRSVELQSEYPEALNNLGIAWQGLKDREKARQAYVAALKLKPDYFAAYSNLGNLYRHDQNYEQAEAMYTSALELRPKDADTWHNLGVIYKDTRRPDLALQAYRKAVDLAPDRLEPADALSEFIRFDDPADPLLERMQKDLGSDQISDRDKQFAAFVLGKAMLDLGRPDQAWQYYRLANDTAYAHAEGIPTFIELLPAYRRVFREDFLERTRGFGREGAPQILVVGFSRSGKSLIESILAAHPGLFAQGERRYLLDFALRKLGKKNDEMELEYLSGVDLQRSRMDADEYLEGLESREGCRPINTFPGNIWALGLLAVLLPQVPIIFCRRNVMDLGLACYFKRYASGNRHTYNLEELGRHIRIYEAFIDLWLEVLPNPMLEVQYEDLVADAEAGARRLYAFLGLEYRPEYLEILETHKDVAANIGLAHSLDAPSPIRKDFVGSAEPFMEQLRPLREAYEAAGRELVGYPAAHAHRTELPRS